MSSTTKIILSAITFDALAYLELEYASLDSGVYDRNRRVTRRRTLDGGVVLDDRGITPGDRDLSFNVRLSLNQITILNHIWDTHSILHASTAEGLYEVAPETFTLDGNLGSCRFLIKSKVA